MTRLCRTAAGAAAALLYLAVSVASNAAPVEGSVPPSPVTPHLALILPTQSKAFANAADAVRQGALAAEQKLGDATVPKLRLYPGSDQDADVLTAYKQALAQGAVAVIGPLTRSGIVAIARAGTPSVPVLALNLPDETVERRNLYLLGLSLEAEARQVAQRMQREGIAQPVVVEAEGVLNRRAREAFVAAWVALGHTEPPVLSTMTDREALTQLRSAMTTSQADAVFLAADLARARLMRPYMGNDRPVYATPRLWNGRFGKKGPNVDLQGVRIVDMPWLLDPHHADVAGFRRAARPLEADLERLYALGIDAYRLTLLLLKAAPDAAIEMQGVSGRLTLNANRQFSRALIDGEIGGDPLTPPPDPLAPAPPGEAPAVTVQPVR
jgi:hypothetical protein